MPKLRSAALGLAARRLRRQPRRAGGAAGAASEQRERRGRAVAAAGRKWRFFYLYVFLGSVLSLMDLTLPCPDHTTLSRRNATVEVRRQIDRAPQGVVCVIVDSTGLKVCGQGEWHAQKHGETKRKRWKKLHIGVDAQGQIIASCVTESHEQDPSQVPSLLDQVDRRINRFIGENASSRNVTMSVQ